MKRLKNWLSKKPFGRKEKGKTSGPDQRSKNKSKNLTKKKENSRELSITFPSRNRT
jgi:hypothetical protein